MQMRSKPNIIITFSVITARKWIELGIKPVRVGYNEIACKHSWEFSKTDVERVDIQYIEFTSRPNKQAKRNTKEDKKQFVKDAKKRDKKKNKVKIPKLNITKPNIP